MIYLMEKDSSAVVDSLPLDLSLSYRFKKIGAVTFPTMQVTDDAK